MTVFANRDKNSKFVISFPNLAKKSHFDKLFST